MVRAWTLGLALFGVASGLGQPLSRILEGASLPLRTLEITMVVRRPGLPEVPLPFVPSLRPGDELVIRRPDRLETSVSVLAAALTAQTRITPKPQFWPRGDAPRGGEEIVLRIPEEESAVVIMVSLHSNRGTGGRMRETVISQGQRLLDSAAIFTLSAEHQARWTRFFDAMATTPNDRPVAGDFRTYATRVAQDLGLKLPTNFDVNDSAGLRESVHRASEVLERLRATNPDQMQQTYARLVEPLLPGPVRDYVDIAYMLYRLAFRPAPRTRLVFAPAVPQFSLDGQVQIVSSRSFPAMGEERTVAYLTLPVGNDPPRRALRVPNPRLVAEGGRLALPIEDLPAPGVPPLLGSPFLWRWQVEIGEVILPAQFVPGQGIVFTFSPEKWKGRDGLDLRVRVRYGPESWMVESNGRLLRPRPVAWSLREEDRARMVAGRAFSIHLTTTVHEALSVREIERVEWVGPQGGRLVARDLVYEGGTLRATFAPDSADFGAGRLEVRLRTHPQPWTLNGVRIFAPLPSLVAQAIRLGEQRLVLESDPSNRVIEVVLPDGVRAVPLAGEPPGRAIVEFPRPVGTADRQVRVRLQDGREVDVPLVLRPMMPRFLAELTDLPREASLGAGATVRLSPGIVLGDRPLQVVLTGAGLYSMRSSSAVEFGLRPRGALPEGTARLGTLARGLAVWDDAAERPQLLANVALAAIGLLEGPTAQGQIMVRVLDSPDDVSAWTPLVAEGGPVILIRTPMVRAVRRDSEGIEIDFAANSGVRGVARTSEGPFDSAKLEPGPVLRGRVAGADLESIWIRIASLGRPLEVLLPPQRAPLEQPLMLGERSRK